MGDKNPFLITELKAGNEKVFEQIFDLYYENLCLYANSFVVDWDSAKDIVQDIFVKLWLKRSDLRIDLSIEGLLKKSVKNKSLDYLKHLEVKQKFRSLILQRVYEGSNELSDVVVEDELREKISGIVHSLPERTRKIFIMSRMQGLKYKEIARELNISEKTVEAHITKALKLFTTQLKNYLPQILLLMIFHPDNF